MKSRYCKIIFNRRAGGALWGGTTPEHVLSALSRAGLISEAAPTGSIEALEHAIAQSHRDGTEVLVAAGGDGTVREIVRRIYGCRLLLGIIPLGTANNLATALEIPRDIDAAARIIAEGRVQQIDLGSLNDEMFTEIGSAGFDAEVFANYGNPIVKNISHAIGSILKAWANWSPVPARIILDDRVIEKRVFQVSAVNTPCYSRGILIAPNAILNDRLFEVVVLGDLLKTELPDYLAATRRGELSRLPKVEIVRSRRIRIESEQPMKVHLDGVPMGTTPAELINRSCSLCVIVPNHSIRTLIEDEDSLL